MTESEQRNPAFSNAKYEISVERLRQVLDYDQITGIFTWKPPHAHAGKPAGSLHYGGYITIRWSGFEYPAHLLAWFYVKGIWQKIDHEDRCKSNNAFINLRPATTSQNNFNREAWSNNKGVKKTRSGKFEARIHKDGIYLHLGTFITFEEAKEVYIIAAKELYGEFYGD